MRSRRQDIFLTFALVREIGRVASKAHYSPIVSRGKKPIDAQDLPVAPIELAKLTIGVGVLEYKRTRVHTKVDGVGHLCLFHGSCPFFFELEPNPLLYDRSYFK